MLKSLKSIVVAAGITLCGFIPAPDESSIKIVVLDAGHGGKDPGTRGQLVKEKDVVLKLVLKLARLIKSEYPDVKVVLTRANDTFVELNERARIANSRKADLFISIHCNATPKSASKTVYGTETFTMGMHKTDENLEVAKRENAVIFQEKNYQENYNGFNPNSPMAYVMLANRQNAYMTSSISLATKIEKQFKGNAKRSSRGVKQAGFMVLWLTSMPSVLIEAGFLSNTEEEKFLSTNSGQNTIAESIFNAFSEYKESLEEQ